MASEYYRTPDESEADRVVPEMTLWYYMALCPESSTQVQFYAQRSMAMRINENEPEDLYVVVSDEEYM